MGILIAALILLNIVAADGMYIPDWQIHIYEPEQKVVIHWDEHTLKETMILSSEVRTDDIANFAWVVPVKSLDKPNVSASNISLFYDLAKYMSEEDYYKHVRDLGPLAGGMAEGDAGVTVIEEKEIDIYDVTVLYATDSQALVDWLNENGYPVNEDRIEIFDKYIDENEEYGWNYTGCYFMVNKVDLKNKYAEEIEIVEEAYDGDESASLMRKATYVHGKKKYSQETRDKAWELYHVLFDLERGVATPLKFEFTTYKPYYPLVITSMSEGYTSIDVYVISNKGIKDVTGPLRVDKAKRLNSEIKDKIKKEIGINPKDNVVTRLAYHGKASELADDSVFEGYYGIYVHPEKLPAAVKPIIYAIQELARLFTTGRI